METKTVIRRYETRRNARREEPTSKSQIDWKRTRRQNILLDSDEDDDDDESACTSEELTPSEDESHEKDTTVDNENSFSNHKEKGHDDAVTEDVEEEECIALGKRKRSSTSVMYDSDKSDDSDIPVRKVLAKRRCILDEDECSQEWKHNKAPSAEEEANDKKQKQTMKLKELSRRRSFQTSSSSERYEEHEDEVAAEEEKSYKLPLTPSESSDVADNDSMKDFIVEDEEECAEHEEDENQFQERQLAMSNSQLLERYVPNFTRCDPSVHIQRVIKAFLINAIDDTFLKSLYEGTRQKRYAQEMLTSLHYLDDRFIQPRLENLISRSRWKDRYKERVDCYPEVRIVMRSSVNDFCQACELHRYCKFAVLLSGKLYDSKTMNMDDFMPHDKQVLKVGSVCAGRTRVYHHLKHFKYKLYQRCCAVTQEDDIEDEPVKDTVDRLFSELDDSGWIQERYDLLQEYMNDADFFQEEKMD